MKPYQELTPKGKIIRMTIVRVVVYSVLLIAFYFACARLYKTITKVRTPVNRDKSLPIALNVISIYFTCQNSLPD